MFLKRASLTLGPRTFCAIVIAIGLALFLLPYPAPRQARLMLEIALAKAPLAVVGSSTVSFVSICDRDRRSLAATLAADTKQKVLDLSDGGQELADSINLAAATIHNHAVETVVLPIAFSQSDDWTTLPYRKLLFYKAATPSFPGYGAASFEDLWQGLRGEPRRILEGYEFEGQRYGDYNALSSTVFAREHAEAACPEVATHDPVFARSYFWWTHVAKVDNKALYPLVGAVTRLLTAHGKRLLVVVLPSNLQLIGSLQPDWVDLVKDRQHAMAASLREAGSTVLDLTADFPADEFGTPWCACVHLNEKGRQHLSALIAASLDGVARQARSNEKPGL